MVLRKTSVYRGCMHRCKWLPLPVVVVLMLVLATGSLAATTTVYVGGPDADGPAGHTFAEAHVTIYVGDSISFTMAANAGAAPHLVQFNPANPAVIANCWGPGGNSMVGGAPALPACDRQFTVAGDYPYACNWHDSGVGGENMHGIIHVVARAAADTAAPPAALAFTAAGLATNGGRGGVGVSLTASGAGWVTGTITSKVKQKPKVQRIKRFRVAAGTQTVKIKVATGAPPKGAATIKLMLMTDDGRMANLAIAVQ